MPKSTKKTNDPISRKLPGRPTDGRSLGRKDGQTLFYRTLPATVGGLKAKLLELFEATLTS